jgi:hypothetical protein
MKRSINPSRTSDLSDCDTVCRSKLTSDFRNLFCVDLNILAEDFFVNGEGIQGAFSYFIKYKY